MLNKEYMHECLCMQKQPHSRVYFDMRVPTLEFTVDSDAEGMKQENEFQRTLISLTIRSPTSSAFRFGKPQSW